MMTNETSHDTANVTELTDAEAEAVCGGGIGATLQGLPDWANVEPPLEQPEHR